MLNDGSSTVMVVRAIGTERRRIPAEHAHAFFIEAVNPDAGHGLGIEGLCIRGEGEEEHEDNGKHQLSPSSLSFEAVSMRYRISAITWTLT